MANWVNLTVDDALSGMTQRERDDFAKASAGTTVPDRLVPILENMVAEIRGYITTWSPNTISADPDKIPPGFKAHAVAIVRWRTLTSIPGYNPGAAREKEYDAANAFFRDVARGVIRPEPADDAVANPTPPEKPAGVQVVSAPPARTGRERMNGL
jgi:hypothetical protein